MRNQFDGEAFPPETLTSPKKGEIPFLVNDLQSAVNAVSSSFEGLKKRLGPVTSLRDDRDPREEYQETPMITPLGAELSFVLRTLRNIFVEIEDLNSKIEL